MSTSAAYSAALAAAKKLTPDEFLEFADEIAGLAELKKMGGRTSSQPFSKDSAGRFVLNTTAVAAIAKAAPLGRK